MCSSDLGAGAIDINNSSVGASFEMFAGIFVHMGRAQHTIDFAFRGQWNRPNRSSCSMVSRFDDLFTGKIEHPPIKGLEPDPDLLLGNGRSHGAKPGNRGMGCRGAEGRKGRVVLHPPRLDQGLIARSWRQIGRAHV